MTAAAEFPYGDKWSTGSGVYISKAAMILKIKERISSGSKLFIGTDSFISNDKITFASALCIYGESKSSFYFFSREKVEKRKYLPLVSRITEEVRRTIELADYFQTFESICSNNIEVHVDASPFSSKNGTSKFSEMLKGYVHGAGYVCKLKPHAWASQSVADKHSK